MKKAEKKLRPQQWVSIIFLAIVSAIIKTAWNSERLSHEFLTALFVLNGLILFSLFLPSVIAFFRDEREIMSTRKAIRKLITSGLAILLFAVVYIEIAATVIEAAAVLRKSR